MFEVVYTGTIAVIQDMVMSGYAGVVSYIRGPLKAGLNFQPGLLGISFVED